MYNLHKHSSILNTKCLNFPTDIILLYIRDVKF